MFYFGTKYSEPMGAVVTNAAGERVPVHMGSHGIGVSRLVGAIIEASHDERGIVWPEGVTPFHCGIVNLRQGDGACDAACEALQAGLVARGLEPLYDDRDERAGAKFATMDLIGLPWRITVGPRGLKGGTVEVASRRTGESEEMSPRGGGGPDRRDLRRRGRALAADRLGPGDRESAAADVPRPAAADRRSVPA